MNYSTNNNIPFFILGRERSGTTLLRVNLNNHSQISVPPESPFIIYLYNKFYHKNGININEFVDELQKELYLSLWKINWQQLKKELSSYDCLDYKTACWHVLSQYGKSNIIGDKNPINSLFPTKIKSIYQHAKFIWLIRDYRAQVNSMLKVNFEKKIVSSLAYRWKAYNKNIEQFKHQNNNVVLMIKYEDLVSNPKENYTMICNFLNIDFEENMLNTSFKDYVNKSHHTSLESKINISHINEWQNELSPFQIKCCEAIAGKYAEKHGYNRVYKLNYFFLLPCLVGIVYGWFYIPFLKILYTLPLSCRKFLNKNIIQKHFKFWKESINNYNNN